ncbi:polysaccharide biosynthesis tyrosine autokinase [Caballeronia sp. LZ034LL]|uniref:polysaccharide biosynthesis tyrosine autokinase n=1 Tax=Caballeronia sp. LZ034LL TaxID=3038567 RepID=UPI00285941BD|nr:polysaccharide biosynthesis tyrosine autokinase [Caballeronia sp. LZ034LL]MDR5836678.1 polysaccharide biosynthesis tyrosine autokinase [Caballeronia sp. LZ034LL]
MKPKDHQNTQMRGNTLDVPDLGAIVATVIDHRWMIGITTAIFMLIGACYAFLAPPVYRADILIQIDDSSAPSYSGSKNLLADATSLFNTKSSAESELQILGSKMIVARAVDALKLYIKATPHYFPLVGRWFARHSDDLPRPSFVGTDGFAWGGESIDVGKFDVPRKLEGSAYKVTILSEGQYHLSGPGLEQPISGKVGVEEQFATPTGTISLFVKKMVGPEGVTFDLVRNSRQLTIEALQQQLRISQEGNKSNVLSASLEGTDPLLLSATINEIGTGYVLQSAERKAASAEESLHFLEQRLPAAQRQMEQAESNYTNYRNQNTLVDLSEASKVILTQAAAADAQLLALQQRRQELEAHFGSGHPDVIAIKKKIALVEEHIDELTARQKEMPIAEQNSMRLMRDVRMNTDLYSALRINMEELRLIKAGKVGTAQLIDLAEVPERPVKPIKMLVLAAFTVLGALVGVVLALGRVALLRGVTDPREVEKLTGVSVFATIPQSERQNELARLISAKASGQLVLASRYPMDPTVECLRVLRSALQHALSNARNNIVLLAGPLPGIGKSFLSANLATVLAAGGKRVLVVDGDLRKGHLNQYFGLPRGRGLADVLSKRESFKNVVHRGVFANLDVLQAGSVPENPDELLLNSGFEDVMNHMSTEYDIVLLDAPAILAVSDAGIMAPFAGSIFLVARVGDTRLVEIEESVKRFAQTGAAVSGVLLNGLRLHGTSHAQARRQGSYTYTDYYQQSDKI